MLTPETKVNSGRLPAWVQPAMTPAPYAPSAPPPDNASHGPFADGKRRAKSVAESPHARASGMPGTLAAAWSSRVKGVRAGSSSCFGLGFGAAFLGDRFFVCA